jgi:hypothetical protein
VQLPRRRPGSSLKPRKPSGKSPANEQKIFHDDEADYRVRLPLPGWRAADHWLGRNDNDGSRRIGIAGYIAVRILKMTDPAMSLMSAPKAITRAIIDHKERTYPEITGLSGNVRLRALLLQKLRTTQWLRRI